MRKIIDRIIAVIFLIMALVLAVMTNWRVTWPGIIVTVVMALVYIRCSFLEETKEEDNNIVAADSPIPKSTLTEVVLLGEDNTKLASWNIYGKNGIVIGRDIGENHVTINLENTTYASMIDIEHAVLNYSGDSWYIEDISEKNGISVQKKDGKKYKLSYGKPCKLERGDIIYIAVTRLKII